MNVKGENFKKEFIARLVRFTIRILKFSDTLHTRSQSLRPVADQLVRSGASIGANVVEASAASSRKDYANFYQIALKSANETKYWLLVVQKYDPSLDPEASELLKEASELANILGSSVLKLKSPK